MIKILAATDGSQPALNACRVTARMLAPGSAEIRLLTVLSYHLYPGSLVPGEHVPGEQSMQQAEGGAIEAATSEARGAFEDAGQQVSVTHRFGNPRDEIIAEVSEWGPDVLVLGRRGVRGLERWLGSVSEHVVRHVQVPVFIVP